MIKYCDDFLTETELQSLFKIMPGLNYTLEDISPRGEFSFTSFQFVHELIKNGKVLSSPHYELFKNLFLDKLDIRKCQRMRVCLHTHSHKVIEHGYHYDWYDIREGDIMNTAIFYFNTCDGYTKIKTEKGKTKKIESLENRIGIFPAHWLHTGTTTSNSQVRIILNIVYQ